MNPYWSADGINLRSQFFYIQDVQAMHAKIPDKGRVDSWLTSQISQVTSKWAMIFKPLPIPGYDDVLSCQS
jgi:hypothetical protein